MKRITRSIFFRDNVILKLLKIQKQRYGEKGYAEFTILQYLIIHMPQADEVSFRLCQ